MNDFNVAAGEIRERQESSLSSPSLSTKKGNKQASVTANNYFRNQSLKEHEQADVCVVADHDHLSSQNTRAAQDTNLCALICFSLSLAIN